MQRAIDAFMGKIRPGSAALLYFSGYGIQTARQTYLLPINAQVWNEADLRQEGVGLDNLLAEVNESQGGQGKDRHHRCCEAQPVRAPVSCLARRTCRYRRAQRQTGHLFRCSRQAGQRGQRRQQCIHHRAHQRAPVPNSTPQKRCSTGRASGVSSATNSEQVPWVASSLVDEFYFGSSRTAATTPSPVPTPPPTPGSSAACTFAGVSGRRHSPANSTPCASACPRTLDNLRAPAEREPARRCKPGDVFRDGWNARNGGWRPPARSIWFRRRIHVNPVHRVTIRKPFAIGRSRSSLSGTDRCVEEKGCKAQPDDRDWAR